MGKVNPKIVWTTCLLSAGVIVLVYFAVPSPDINGFVYLLAALIGATVSAFLIKQKSDDGQGDGRLRALANILPIHIAEIGTDMRFNYINARFDEDLLTRMKHWSDLELDTVIGEKVEDILNPDSLQRVQKHMEKVFQGETVKVEFELPPKEKNGAPVIRRGNYIPKFGEQGGVEGFFILTEDVTYRRKAEEALKNSETLHRSLTELLPLSIIVMFKDRVVYCNAAAVQLYGAKTENEILGADFMDFVHPDHHEFVQGRKSQRMQKGMVDLVEYKQLRLDGSVIYTEVGGLSIPWEGEKAGMLVIRDITEQREIERMKSEFISIVSHELRTPLTSIKGALDLIEGGALEEVPEKISDMIGIASQNTERLSNLVNDLLDFEKLQSGKVDYDFKSEPIDEIVEASVEINLTYAERHGVSFNFACDDLKILVRADRQRLSQVVTNLLSNAAKFSASGDVVNIYVEKREESVRVSIADKGPGVAENDRLRIFERFGQSDSSDTRSVGGTGLGLNISKAIIEDHNGQIDFVSEVGKGSVFYFDLPLVE